jgi:beta-glucanase (GH16 family)
MEVTMSGNWKMVWHDEFEGSGIDRGIWTPVVGGGGFGNNELQFYSADPANAWIEAGNLVIEARREDRAGCRYTSAKLTTQGKKLLRYGKLEVRAKLPQGVGSWPAIWMLPEEAKGYGEGWPASGEIDIMEHVGHDPGVVHFSIHTSAFNHKIKTQKTSRVGVPDAMNAFHAYGVEWSPERLEFQLDGKTEFTIDNPNATWREWPFDKPFYVILNVAVGGDWGGVKGVDENAMPYRMCVDWVRAYTRA